MVLYPPSPIPISIIRKEDIAVIDFSWEPRFPYLVRSQRSSRPQQNRPPRTRSRVAALECGTLCLHGIHSLAHHDILVPILSQHTPPLGPWLHPWFFAIPTQLVCRLPARKRMSGCSLRITSSPISDGPFDL